MKDSRTVVSSWNPFLFCFVIPTFKESNYHSLSLHLFPGRIIYRYVTRNLRGFSLSMRMDPHISFLKFCVIVNSSQNFFRMLKNCRSDPL